MAYEDSGCGLCCAREWMLMSSLDEKALGRRLQEARQAAGLTQQALCQKANLSYSTLAKIERGAIKSPSIFTIQSIAAALDITLDDLIGSVNLPALPPRPRLHSKSGIGFVYFDVNGCLVQFFHGAFAKLSAITNQPPDIIETVFWHFNDQVCRGEMTVDEFDKACAEQLHVPSIDWQKYYLDTVEPIPETHELITWASERYGVGLLTNIMPGFLDAMKQRGLIPNIQYDAVVDSSVVHAIKPEAKMYEIATQQAGYPASEILLVDDSRTNLMAAEKSGWRVLWFDDYHPEESVTRIHDALEPASEPEEQFSEETAQTEQISSPSPPTPHTWADDNSSSAASPMFSAA
jgi:FMN phosphatase YigB (HAD superfamily)/DNA-binding XRE family transcriptional regulator